MVEMANTTNRRNALLEMFLDATPREAYANGRLKTVPTENGVQLVAYHEHVLAHVNRGADEITLYTGHHRAHSTTVTRYVHELGKLLNSREGFDVTVLDGYAPTTGYGRVSTAAQYIGEYIGRWNDTSAAEDNILDEVNRSLDRHL